MGKKDLWQSDYFDDKRRFADMMNGSLFRGNQVVRAEELEEADSKLVYHDTNGEVQNVIRDKTYRWKGQYVSICVLENQSYVDYRMVLRVMLEEAVSYIKQQKRAFRRWKESGYKFSSDEFLSQMRKEEKFVPVITLVVYLGKEGEWDGAKTLYELLEVGEEVKPFVTNHKINVFDYHEYQEYSQFHTENRLLFELLSKSKDREKTGEIMRKYMNDYSTDEETMKAILGILDIKTDINKYKKKTKKGVRYHMCKAWDDQKESGRIEGRREGRRVGRREGRRVGRREGEQNALQKSLRVLIGSLKEYSIDFENIYQSVVKQEIYSGVTREQVMEYYKA